MALQLKQRSEYRRDDGSWDWSVWLDGPGAELDRVSHVVYTLHPSFPHPVRTVADRATRFQLDASGWGEFRLYATAVYRAGEPAYLEHELTLIRPDGTDAPHKGMEGERPARSFAVLGPTEVALLGIYLAILAVVGAYAIVVSWPDGSGRINLLWGDLAVVIPAGREVRLALVAAFCGAVGALAQSGPSMVGQARRRPLARWWGWWYLIRPFTGMALALVVYLVVRGVLFSAEATAAAVSTSGVAALGAVVGLVSRRATSQLQRAFQRLFAAPAGKGSHPTGSTPSHGEPGAAVAG